MHNITINSWKRSSNTFEILFFSLFFSVAKYIFTKYILYLIRFSVSTCNFQNNYSPSCLLMLHLTIKGNLSFDLKNIILHISELLTYSFYQSVFYSSSPTSPPNTAFPYMCIVIVILKDIRVHIAALMMHTVSCFLFFWGGPLFGFAVVLGWFFFSFIFLLVK